MENKKVSKNIPFFIGIDRKKIFGEEAKQKILFHNDTKYFNPEKGVSVVDRNRWEEAQKYETKIWMQDSKSNDDGNKTKMKGFDDYDILAGKHFDKIIELGCGPFTNLRYIIPAINDISNSEIVLSDPLLKEYLKKNNCTYKKGLTLGENTYWNRIFGKKIKVVLNNEAIEDFSTNKRFNLIVMIDVIEHCMDFDKICKKILDISESGSYFVLSDKIFSAKETERELKNIFDAGHPLKVDKGKVDEFLYDNFREIYSKHKFFEAYRGPRDLSYTNFYYIGVKK